MRKPSILIFTSCEENEGQNQNKQKCDKSFDRVAELEYLKTILTYPGFFNCCTETCRSNHEIF